MIIYARKEMWEKHGAELAAHIRAFKDRVNAVSSEDEVYASLLHEQLLPWREELFGLAHVKGISYLAVSVETKRSSRCSTYITLYSDRFTNNLTDGWVEESQSRSLPKSSDLPPMIRELARRVRHLD